MTPSSSATVLGRAWIASSLTLLAMTRPLRHAPARPVLPERHTGSGASVFTSSITA
jgi:hypothetical protein